MSTWPPTNPVGFVPKPKRLTAAERSANRRKGGWRTAKKVNKFGGRTQAGKTADKRKHEIAVKRETRAIVWRRSHGCCEYCGDTERDTAAKFWKSTHEQDEVKPRSLTRGEAPEIRFAVENTARACAPCHKLKTYKRIKPRFHDLALGMNGDYDVIETATQRVLYRMRRVKPFSA